MHKVDRSAAYAARWVAKSVVAAGLAHRALVQLSYAIGVSHPLSIFVDTYGTGMTRLVEASIVEKSDDSLKCMYMLYPPILDLRRPTNRSPRS